MPLTVLAHIGGTEATGHIEVDLQRATLPIATDGVPQDEFQLGAVKSTLPRIQAVFETELRQRFLQSGFCFVPDLVGSDTFRRAIRELDSNIVEPEFRVQAQDQFGHADALFEQLVHRAEAVTVVLSEGAYPHQPMQCTRRLIAVNLAELRKA